MTDVLRHSREITGEVRDYISNIFPCNPPATLSNQCES